MIFTLDWFNFRMTSSSGFEAMKQRSSEPGTATWARGANSLPHSCRLIFWLPNLSARRSSVGVRKRSSLMPSTSV